MELEDLGYNETFKKFASEGFEHGRIISEHKERYIVKTGSGDFEAEITGNLRFTTKYREDFPAVGDWVALVTYGSDLAIIHKILPRFSIIKRQAVGRSGEVQVIASNIDYALLVQAADRDFNINRLERYLTLCHEAQVKPVIVLTKTDLISEGRIKEITDNIKTRIREVPVYAISNETLQGYEALKTLIQKGKTYCMLGSSGVGKSTMLNNLTGKMQMKTEAISDSTGKGKHVTSHRELMILDNGGILIDNPGMREVGIADAGDGLEITFDRITRLSQDCKFKDCTHVHEVGCAVLDAVAKGEIDSGSYDNYMKMEREKVRFESTLAERRQKEKKTGRMVKNWMKTFKKNKE